MLALAIVPMSPTGATVAYFSLLAVLFAIWGSFLNMLAYRLISDESLFISRSFCPSCKHTIAWYDNIPGISWFILKGHCRSCARPISVLYPFIEILTMISCLMLYYWGNPQYFLSYFIFFSALIVTVRTDLEHMLIASATTLYLIPVGYIASTLGILPITPLQSLLGAGSAYVFSYICSTLFFLYTKRSGLGFGDIELLAFIGSFLGTAGWWIALFIGSFTGAVISIGYLSLKKMSLKTPIPFGPFLALGALIYVLLNRSLMNIMSGFILF